MLVGFNAVGITRSAGSGGAGLITDGDSESSSDESRGLDQVDGGQIPEEDVTGLGVLELQDVVADLGGGHLDGDTAAVGVGEPGVAEGLAGGDGLHLTGVLGDNPQVDGVLEVVDNGDTAAGGGGGGGAGRGGGAGINAGASGHGDRDAGHGRDNGSQSRVGDDGSGGGTGDLFDSDGSSHADGAAGLVDGFVDGLPDGLLDVVVVGDGNGVGGGSQCQKGREGGNVEAHIGWMNSIFKGRCLIDSEIWVKEGL